MGGYMIRNILFDLDGTIIDSKEGILHSVCYALDKMGRDVPDEKELLCFIGPPLSVSFATFCGMNAEETERAVAFYRENYAPRGVYEFSVYPGVETMLKKLSSGGRRLYLATSKPEVFAKKILEKAGLDSYFTAVCGSLIPSGRDKKEDVISYLVENEGLSLDETVMVGDRSYDAEGAHAVGLVAIGVSYGYGSVKELNRAGFEAIASSPKELASIIQRV